jgi:hypothetical protein
MNSKFLIGLVAFFGIIQLFRPARNESNDQTYDMSKKYAVPAEVADILKVACNDCHTNKTEYPWYANVQPGAWFLDHHVTDGKRHLNLSTFTKMPVAVQNHKFEEIMEQVEKKEMPLASYTYFGLHPQAKLTDAQRQIIVKWAKTNMDSLKAQYPADSLVMRRRGGTPPAH